MEDAKISLNELRHERDLAPDRHMLVHVNTVLALIHVAEAAECLYDSAPGRLELNPTADFDADLYSNDLAALRSALARFT